MSIQRQRESVAEATIHQLRQLQAPDSLLNVATECTWVTDDENGVRRQFDLVTGCWSWKINGVWRYEQPQQADAMPFTEQEHLVLLIMREVHLRAPHWDSRTMTKDQIVQVLQLKTAWKWDPKEAPDARVYRVCAEHGQEEEDETMPSTHGPVGKEVIEAKPVGYQGPGHPVWEYYGFDPETPGGEPEGGEELRTTHRGKRRTRKPKKERVSRRATGQEF